MLPSGPIAPGFHMRRRFLADRPVPMGNAAGNGALLQHTHKYF